MRNPWSRRRKRRRRDTPNRQRTRGADRAPSRQLIVVAEDDALEWDIYGKMLWYNGYDTLHARDGEEALRLVTKHEPDLVILDLVLPKLDGLELCRRLKANPATRHIPTLALTGRPRWEKGRDAHDAGCADYLEKPMSPLDVLHAVEKVIGRAPLPGDAPRGLGPEELHDPAPGTVAGSSR